jgi:hypothetical protein
MIRLSVEVPLCLAMELTSQQHEIAPFHHGQHPAREIVKIPCNGDYSMAEKSTAKTRPARQQMLEALAETEKDATER